MPHTNTPLEIANVVRQKTLYFNSHLTKFDAEKGHYPLMTYDVSNLSRYEVVLIDEKKPAVANIPLTAMWKVQRLTDFYYNKHLEAVLMKGESELSSGYTVQFTSGNLKGKTPAQIIFETEDKEEAKKVLRKQYVWLKDNAKRYPKNVEQMNAILDAVKLFEAGQLSATKTKQSGTATVIYEAQMRPLRSKRVPQELLAKNKNFCFVYDITIEWALGAENAVTVTICNYYAPVLVDDKGMNKVYRKDADKDTFIKISMNISADEWANIIRFIDMDMRRFEMLNAKDSYTTAMAIDQKLREERRG